MSYIAIQRWIILPPLGSINPICVSFIYTLQKELLTEQIIINIYVFCLVYEF